MGKLVSIGRNYCTSTCLNDKFIRATNLDIKAVAVSSAVRSCAKRWSRHGPCERSVRIISEELCRKLGTAVKQKGIGSMGMVRGRTRGQVERFTLLKEEGFRVPPTYQSQERRRHLKVSIALSFFEFLRKVSLFQRIIS